MALTHFRKAQEYLTEWVVTWIERPNFTTLTARKDIEQSHKGVLNHHTGSWHTTDWMLFVDGNGRVDAPLCNVAVETNGAVIFGSWQYTNHAGFNDKDSVMAVLKGPGVSAEIKPGPDSNPQFSGNRYLIGVEVKSPGSFNEAQYKATVALNAAFVLAYGWNPLNPPIGAHKEVTRRKPGDPGDDMAQFRRDVVEFIAAHTKPVEPDPEPETPPVVVVPPTPKFPLKAAQYYGPRTDKSDRCVSGYEVRAGNAGLKRWQTQAKALNAYTGTPDGKYGPLTKKAAQGIQRKYKLDPDGLIGKLTWDATFKVQ